MPPYNKDITTTVKSIEQREQELTRRIINLCKRHGHDLVESHRRLLNKTAGAGSGGKLDRLEVTLKGEADPSIIVKTVFECNNWDISDIIKKTKDLALSEEQLTSEAKVLTQQAQKPIQKAEPLKGLNTFYFDSPIQIPAVVMIRIVRQVEQQIEDNIYKISYRWLAVYEKNGETSIYARMLAIVIAPTRSGHYYRVTVGLSTAVWFIGFDPSDEWQKTFIELVNN